MRAVIKYIKNIRKRISSLENNMLCRRCGKLFFKLKERSLDIWLMRHDFLKFINFINPKYEIMAYFIANLDALALKIFSSHNLPSIQNKMYTFSLKYTKHIVYKTIKWKQKMTYFIPINNSTTNNKYKQSLFTFMGNYTFCIKYIYVFKIQLG